MLHFILMKLCRLHNTGSPTIFCCFCRHFKGLLESKSQISTSCFGLKRFPSGPKLGYSSSVRPTRRAAILEELAAAGEEGTAGDDEAELIGGEKNLNSSHLKFLKSRVKGEGGAWCDQGRPCPRHPLHVLLHPLLEDWLHRGQCWIPSNHGNLPHLLHSPWLHSSIHLCPCHQWSSQRWWSLFHAVQNNGTRVWRIHW